MTYIPPCIWIDIETTGLNPELDQILEIGAIATGEDFKELDRFQTVIRPDKLDIMSLPSVVYDMHKNNGLLDELRGGLDREEAQRSFLDWIDRAWKLHPPPDDQWEPMKPTGNKLRNDAKLLASGSTIEFDVSFMRPFVGGRFWDGIFNYRLLNVSSVKEIVRRSHGEGMLYDSGTAKAHRAISDVEDSLAELHHYLELMGAA